MNNSLINAVKDVLGRDEYLQSTMQEVCEHGAMGGFSGFTYYHETGEFFEANKSAIVEHAKSTAEDCGVGFLEFIASFNCLNGGYSVDEVGEVVFGGDKEHESYTYIVNALAWYALEEASRYCTDCDDFSDDEKGGE